ncbi:hypothetical protein V8G54_008025 [Vigna mungo]|uniref:Chromo domain-containing protein n=1 Tax=Vigna mungo TaxID=3915 RepID=A0AAQ3S8U8_VIGMU
MDPNDPLAVQKLLGERDRALTQLKRSKLVSLVLVQWVGLPATEATWEDIPNFVKAYPDFNLEDKVIIDREGIVTCEKNVETEGQNQMSQLENQDTWHLLQKIVANISTWGRENGEIRDTKGECSRPL